MKKKVPFILATVLGLALLVNTPSFAQMTPDGEGFAPSDEMGMPPPGEGHGGMGKGGKYHQGMEQKKEEFFKQLNLTEEQKNKLKTQKEAAKSQIKNLRTQLHTERSKLMDIMSDPNSTKEAMFAQQDKVNSLMNQLSRIRIESMASLKAILTPEQRQKFAQMASERKQKFMQKREQWKNKHGQRGQGQKRQPPEFISEIGKRQK